MGDHTSEQLAAAAASADLGYGRGGLVRRVLGRLLWPFFRHQIVVNRTLLAQVDGLADALAAHGALSEQLGQLRQRLEHAEFELARARGDIEHHTSVLVRHEEPLDRHEFLLKHLEPAFVDLQRAVDLVHDKVDLGQRQAFARYFEGIGPLRSAIGEVSARLAELEAGLDDRQRSWQGAWSEVQLRLAQLDLYLTEARRAYPQAVPPERLAALPSGFASLYGLFEEAFRGPRSLVQDQLRAYLDVLRARPEGSVVLELGAGRGALLSLLREAEIPAYGVEVADDALRRASAAGLDVRQEEARAHLASLTPGCVGAICAIELVEKLSADELVELLELAARALAPEGVLVIEALNPENLVVAASSLHLDPSRRRLVPPELLAFLVETRGFGEVEVRRLPGPRQPAELAAPKPDDPWAAQVAPLVEVVNHHLLAPPRYALVAKRP